MAQFPNNKYSCSQSALYSVCDTITDNLEANLADFTAFKGIYDAAFVTALRAAIAAARNLPDEQARGEAAETFRVQLALLNDKCMLNWQSLKRYIEEVYPKGEWKAKEEAAGQTYYKLASQENWENTVSMNESAGNFITANTVTLSNGGLNMPAGFPVQYAGDALAYLTLYNQFKAAMETGDLTEAKITANNDLYEEVIEICKDGTIIYDGDAGKAKLFTWSTVLEIVTPPGAASLTVTVLLDESNDPAVGALVKIKIQGTTVETQLIVDESGEVLFEDLEPATYAWGCTLEGRHPEVGLKEISTGVHSHLEIRLIV